MSSTHYCSKRSARANMTDEEFWDDVAETLGSREPDVDDMEYAYNGFLSQPSACPECGEFGACGYDSQGRPMIHAVKDEDDEQG
jgi:hypothetical protein